MSQLFDELNPAIAGDVTFDDSPLTVDEKFALAERDAAVEADREAWVEKTFKEHQERLRELRLDQHLHDEHVFQLQHGSHGLSADVLQQARLAEATAAEADADRLEFFKTPEQRAAEEAQDEVWEIASVENQRFDADFEAEFGEHVVFFDPHLEMHQLVPKTNVYQGQKEFDDIPPFDPTVSKTVLRSVVSDLSISDPVLIQLLTEKGYPWFMIQMCVQSRRTAANRSKRVDELVAMERRRSSKYVEAVEKSRQAKIGHNKHVAPGKKVPPPLYWRVPFSKGTRVVSRPTAANFTKYRFRTWVQSTAERLRIGLKPGQFVSASDMVKSLYMGMYVGSKPHLADILSRCELYVASYCTELGYDPHRSGQFRILFQEDKRELWILGFRVSNVTELAEFGEDFRKHKPVFRVCVQYLSGEFVSPEELVRLKRFLQVHFPKRQVLQGNTPSVNVRVHPPENDGAPLQAFTVQHEVLFPQLEPAFAEIRSLFVTEQERSLMRPMVQIGSFFVSVSQSKDWVGVCSAVLSLITGNDFLWSRLSAAIQSVRNPFQTFQNAFLDKTIAEMVSWQGFKEVWAAVVSSFVGFILQTLTDGYNFLIPNVYSIVCEARSFLTKEAGVTLGRSLLAGVNEVILRLKRCVEERSLTPLWGESWDPRRWVRTIEGMITYYPILTATGVEVDSEKRIQSLRDEGKIPVWWTGPVTIGDFLARGEALYLQGKVLTKHFKLSPDISREISSCNSRFRMFLDNLQSTVIASSERIAPFMVMLQGPPGGGKTNLAKTIAKAIGQVHGYDNSSAGFYDWQEGVNFQDGLSHTQWCVHMDDVDQGVAKDQAGTRNFVQNVLALVNNAPMPVEAAAVEMKGKLRANPRLLTYCSNFESGNLQGHTQCPVAFWRRVGLRVYVEALPEYSKGSGVLDRVKANAADTYDMFKLCVSYFDPSLVDPKNLWKIPMTNFVIMSVSELMVDIQERYAAHLSSEMERLKARTTTGDICLKCGLDVSRKSCAHVRPEVPPPPALVREMAKAVESQEFIAERDALESVFSEDEMETSVQVFQGGTVSRCRRSLYSAVVRIDELLEQFCPEIVMKLAGIIGTVALAGIACRVIVTQFQGRAMNAVEGLVPKGWFRADQDFQPGLPPSGVGVTYTKDDLLQALRTNVVHCYSEKDAGGQAFIVGQNLILMPTHYFEDKPLVVRYGQTVSIVAHGREIKMQLTELNFKSLPSNPHLALLRCGTLKGVGTLMTKMWSHDDLQITSFDEVEIWSDVLLHTTSSNSRMQMEIGPVWSTNAQTVVGDCGSVYVARHGTAWKIIAMHYSLMLNKSTDVGRTTGGITTRQEIAKVASTIGAVFQGVETVKSMLSRVPAQVEMHSFPVKSEVWVAMSNGARVYPFGEIWPPMSGSTMKTRMEWSLVRELFTDLEIRACGQAGYWRFPEFRGKMEGDRWVSPYTEAFTAENKGTFKDKLMWIALADYLHGMGDLNVEGFGELSEQQAVKGIAGSYIHAANLKTSVGPPFNQSKRLHVVSGPDEVYFSPELSDMFDQINLVLSSGEIPAAVGLCTLKDEPVKPDKKPRVFTCLPAAYNFIMKQHYSSIKSFMRAHFTFFESAVGIDMTGSDAMRVVNFLKTISPELDCLWDADARKLDKAWDGPWFDFVAYFFYAVAWVIGVDKAKVFLLALGIKHTRFVIKGDIFSVFWNPSGHDDTVEFNGVLMSLGERYVYYASRVDDFDDQDIQKFVAEFFSSPLPKGEWTSKLDFRRNVALVTYGDDNVKATRGNLPANYQEIWLTELGIELTDAEKTSTFVRKDITRVQFLKRRFVWSSEFRRYLTPLDLKSIVRMLLIKKESVLTSRDHACVAMAEALREMVYHGQGEYDALLAIVRVAIARHELQDNGYLRIYEYSHWAEQLRQGVFTAWEPRVYKQDVKSSD